MKNKKVLFIIPFIFLSLLLGIYTGWLRLGWNIPMSTTIAHHGLIMIGSLVATLIIIERIVSIKKAWLYFLPFINAMSLPAFYFQQDKLALIFLMVGSSGLFFVYFFLYIKYRERYIVFMMVGGLFLLLGILIIFFKNRYPDAVPYWIGFLLLTILGERIDLGKFLPYKKFKLPILWFSLSFFIIGLFTHYYLWGHWFSGCGMILLAIWLLKYDIVNKSIKSHGIHKYIGVVLFSGYIWLLFSGILMILNLNLVFFYDALLHSFFLGFVFLMIFAHGPIIFPGVMGFTFTPFHKSLYTWMFLLNVSLALRIIADVLFLINLRQLSGLLNGVVIIGFFINLLIVIRMKLLASRKTIEKN